MLYAIFSLLPLLVVVAVFTLAERRVMASIQRRQGCTLVGTFGILQPFADGLKLVIKEIIFPSRVNRFFFFLSPLVVLFISLLNWCVVINDVYSIVLNVHYSALFILVLSSLNVYGVFLAGWSSNSKYAVLGALRSVSLMLSYEVVMSLCSLVVFLFCGSANLNKIIYTQVESGCWLFFPLLPIAVIFFICIVAETNRLPFDLAEAEAELVAGYNVEYSGITFAAFFLGEYMNIIFMSNVFVCFFLGGSDFKLVFSCIDSVLEVLQQLMLAIKIVIIASIFIFIRANLPRFRFDQLMYISWKIFLPVCTSFLIIYASILYGCDALFVHQIPQISIDTLNFIVYKI